MLEAPSARVRPDNGDAPPRRLKSILAIIVVAGFTSVSPFPALKMHVRLQRLADVKITSSSA